MQSTVLQKEKFFEFLLVSPIDKLYGVGQATYAMVNAMCITLVRRDFCPRSNRCETGVEGGGLLLPGAPQTALSNLMAYYPLGGFGRRLGSERHRHCCRLIIIGTYKIDPIRRYHAGKKPVFNTPRQSLSHPRNPIPPKPNGIWWRCRVPPPGPKRLLHRSFISIAASSSCILAKVFPEIQQIAWRV